LDANIVLNFSENVDAVSGNITIKKTSDNSTVETISVTSGQVTGSGTSQITINPSSNFDNNTEYYVLIDATAFDDVDSGSYAGISSTTDLSFTVANTMPGGEFIPPQLIMQLMLKEMQILFLILVKMLML